jgi:hypothetical protein
VDGATGETTWLSSVKDCPEKYGARFIFLKHADLHAGLLKHLKATEGHEVKFHLNTNVTDINCEGGTLTTSTGSVFEKDLIVVANGLGVRPIPQTQNVHIANHQTSANSSRPLLERIAHLLILAFHSSGSWAPTRKSQEVPRFGLFSKVKMTRFAFCGKTGRHLPL